MPQSGPTGLTVREVAALFRVAPAKVRQWIRQGKLPAVNVASSYGRQRLTILPSALEEFARTHSAASPPRRKRQKPKPPGFIHYYRD